MAELRDLNDKCICGSAGSYHCRQCTSKKYCSKTCQRKDWPMHKLICRNQDVISTAMSARTSDWTIDYCKFMGPAWVRFLDLTYETLRSKLGPNAGPEEHVAYWVGIVEHTICKPPQISAVAFVFIAQEPTRLYMFVDKPVPYEGQSVLIASDEDLGAKRLLDARSIIYNLDTHRKSMNTIYPLNVARPHHIETIVDWELKSRS